MDYNTFGLLITDKCTAACSFCGLSCSPKNSAVMPLSLAKRAIDEARDAGVFERCALSGGEPLIYSDLAADILDYAKESGFERRTLTSNGFWGMWSDAKIDDLLDSISACTHISFSYDFFHAEYVRPEHFWRAVESVQERRMSYSIHIADVPGEKSAGRFIASQGDRAFFKNYNIYPLLPSGRAAELQPELFFRDMDGLHPRCDAGGMITIRYDGVVFPCCVPGIQESCFKLGNLNDMSLSEMLFGSGASRLLRLLRSPGCFAELAELAEQKLNIKLPRRVVNGCEVCCKIFESKDSMKALEPYIQEIHDRPVIDRLFGRGEQRWN